MTQIERHLITDRTDWLARRKQDITASEVAALFGCHPYKTAAEVYLEKLGQFEQPEETDEMRRGRLLEPIVAREVRRTNPEWSITPASEYLRNPAIRLGATPDFYVQRENGSGKLQHAILETKTAAASLFDRDWQGTPPLWIMLQIATQQLLAGADSGVVACLAVGEHRFSLHQFEVPRHAGTEKRIIDAVQAFWQAFGRGEAPAWDFSRDAATIKRFYAREGEAKTIDLRGNSRIGELLFELQAAKVERDAQAARVEQADAEIRALIGDHDKAVVDGWLVTNKLIHRKQFVTPATDYRRLAIKRSAE